MVVTPTERSLCNRIWFDTWTTLTRCRYLYITHLMERRLSGGGGKRCRGNAVDSAWEVARPGVAGWYDGGGWNECPPPPLPPNVQLPLQQRRRPKRRAAQGAGVDPELTVQPVVDLTLREESDRGIGECGDL